LYIQGQLRNQHHYYHHDGRSASGGGGSGGGGQRRARVRAHEAAAPPVAPPGGCLWNEAHFSHDLTFLAVDCRGPQVPQTLIIKTSLRKETQANRKETGPALGHVQTLQEVSLQNQQEKEDVSAESQHEKVNASPEDQQRVTLDKTLP